MLWLVWTDGQIEIGRAPLKARSLDFNLIAIRSHWKQEHDDLFLKKSLREKRNKELL